MGDHTRHYLRGQADASRALGQASDDSHPHEAILFPCLAGLLGIAVQYFSTRSRILDIFPFTVWIFILGIFVGLCHKETNGSFGTLSKSIDLWTHIDPHLILYAFLPILLFGDSMNIKWHDFKRTVAQCAILAGPGLVMGTFIMWVVAYYIFPYNWTVHEAAAFASILAATDPVAVVGILKEMGAKRTLTMQIAGESLLNDGVAIVVWTIFFNGMQGENPSIGDFIWSFVRLGIGGALWGIFCGYIALQGIHFASDTFVHTDQLVQLAITIVIAYLSFFIGESELRVSGVLSTIFTAIVLAKDAWPLMCNADAVHHVWHCLEFFGNAILFLLCGCVWYMSCYNVRFVDFFWLLFMYLMATLARALMILVAYPFLNLVAKSKAAKVTWKECLVMCWGGLRGAVGLALALSMEVELAAENKNVTGDLMVFLIGGFAGLTLLINATTCGLLLENLGMTKPSNHVLCLLHSLQAKLYDEALENLKMSCDQDLRWSGVDQDAIETLLDSVHDHETHKADIIHHAENVPVSSNDQALKQEDDMLLKVSSTDSEPLPVSIGAGCSTTSVAPTSASVNSFSNKTVSDTTTASQNLKGSLPPFPLDTRTHDSATMSHQSAVPLVRSTQERSGPTSNHWWWGFRPVKDRLPSERLETPVANADSKYSSGQMDIDLKMERKLYLSMVRAEYGAHLRGDTLPEHAEGARDLFASIDQAEDYCQDELKDWHMLVRSMCNFMFNRILDCLIVSPFKPYFRLRSRAGGEYDLFTVVIFLDAHHTVCNRLLDHEEDWTMWTRMKVLHEAWQQMEVAHEFLVENKVGPTEIGIVRTKQLASLLFARQRKNVEKWVHQGIITEKEAEELLVPVHQGFARIECSKSLTPKVRKKKKASIIESQELSREIAGESKRQRQRLLNPGLASEDSPWNGTVIDTE